MPYCIAYQFRSKKLLRAAIYLTLITLTSVLVYQITNYVKLIKVNNQLRKFRGNESPARLLHFRHACDEQFLRYKSKICDRDAHTKKRDLGYQRQALPLQEMVGYLTSFEFSGEF